MTDQHPVRDRAAEARVFDLAKSLVAHARQIGAERETERRAARAKPSATAARRR